jgi:hypothetical protein
MQPFNSPRQFTMTKDLSLIVAQPLAIAQNWSVVGNAAKQEIETAIAAESLLARVTNAETNDRAQKARAKLRQLKNQLERERKVLAEPLLEAKRALDRAVAVESERLDIEDGRLAEMQRVFAVEEQNRLREEAAVQQRELQRIEDEKKAKLAEIERQKVAGQVSESVATQQAELVQENAELLSRAEAAPILPTRSVGQITKTVWKIVQINDFQLMKARPDLVRKVEWDLVGIKQALDAGQTLPGVKAEKDLSVGVRARKDNIVNV